MTINERLNAAIKNAGLSYGELADKTGIFKSAIQRYAVGATAKIPIDRLEKLAKALNVSTAYLMGWEEKSESEGNVTRLTSSNTRRIPLIGGIAAGDPVYDETVGVYVATDIDKANYAMRVEGDSMMPTFQDGDIVYLREQPDVENGQIAAVQTEEGWRLKHVHHIQGGLLLVSENPKYAPVMVTADDQPRILGLAIGFTRCLK